ncbi:hypothetical protein BVRB_4g091320 [Beta vulgaris subsp. vulgaris]|nr:hypothetical protein BVRB_4g091320 [Beta vulgaris subsp. vulgaris]
MVLGGYSVLGDFVSEYVDNKEIAEIEKKLCQVHQEISRGQSQKCNQGVWINHFMKLGGESEIEHEAFISVWLSRFVLPTFPYDTVLKKYFKIAICLARGVHIALGPVVLASIYRDLSLLKSGMISCSSMGVKESGKDDCFDDLIVVTLWAPLQLVQVWGWERFQEFRPKPNLIEYGEPRLARWDGVNEVEIGNVRPMLQSAGHTFEWRPYCKNVENLALPSFYRENEECVIVGDGLDDDTKSLVRFLRVCELVGMDTIEQYNPNRVAMQFGFDQDVPKQVKRDLVGSDIPKKALEQLAWFSYINPIRDEILFVPSKLYEPQVTLRYLKWLRQGLLTRQVALDGVVRKKRGHKRSRRSQDCRNVKNVVDNSIAVFDIDVKPKCLTSTIDKDLDVPPGFLTKYNVTPKKADVPVGFTQKKNNVGLDVDVPPGFVPKTMGDKIDVPPGFAPKFNGKTTLQCVVENYRCGSESQVKVKKECLEYVENSKALFNCGYQSKITSPPEVEAKGEGSLKYNVGLDVDVPPGFVPKTMDNKLDVPPGFAPKSNEKSILQCVLEKYSFEKSKPLFEFGHQRKFTSPAEVEAKGERSLKTKGGENSGKSERVMAGVEQISEHVDAKIAKTLVHGRDGKIDRCSDKNTRIDLEARIRQLEMRIAELTEARSDKVV